MTRPIVKSGSKLKSPRYVAVIADMIASRALPPPARQQVQKDFTRLMGKLNRRYSKNLAAKFVITTGDECQGLLRSPEIIPDLVWTLEQLFTARAWRLGFGYGVLHTALKEYAVNIDGPAFHVARKSIESAKEQHLRGGVFIGFGPVLDGTLNGLARVLHHQRESWTSRQREIAWRLREGVLSVEIAKALGITKQAVSRHAAAAGWKAYLEGDQAWTLQLQTLKQER